MQLPTALRCLHLALIPSTYVELEVLLDRFAAVDALDLRVGPRVFDQHAAELENLLKHADHEVAVEDVLAACWRLQRCGEKMALSSDAQHARIQRRNTHMLHVGMCTCRQGRAVSYLVRHPATGGVSKW